VKKQKLSISRLFVLGIILLLVVLLVFRFKGRESIQIVPSSSPSSLLLSDSKLRLPLSSNFIYAKVTRVIDGDTIVIDSSQKIRYIGMNTPEIETSECYATEASEINKNLVLGKEVRLEKDVSETDKYGRLLRYVYVGDTFINNELVKDGSAKVETVKPDVKYESEFVTWQKFAKVNKLGLWGRCPNIDFLR